MGPTIDDLVPAEPASMPPQLRLDTSGRVVLTVIADGRHRRLVLTSDQFGDLAGDVVRIVTENAPRTRSGLFRDSLRRMRLLGRICARFVLAVAKKNQR